MKEKTETLFALFAKFAAIQGFFNSSTQTAYCGHRGEFGYLSPGDGQAGAKPPTGQASG